MTHHDHEHHPPTGELSFEEKMAKRIEHWLKHNTDHADTYREWAGKARQNGMTEIGDLLDEIADKTLALNARFEAAAKLVK